MPFVKPGTLIELQYVVDSWETEHLSQPDGADDAMRQIMGLCPICGSSSCTKTVVKVNGVYVHQEDAANAEPISRGELPE